VRNTYSSVGSFQYINCGVRPWCVMLYPPSIGHIVGWDIPLYTHYILLIFHSVSFYSHYIQYPLYVHDIRININLMYSYDIPMNGWLCPCFSHFKPIFHAEKDIPINSPVRHYAAQVFFGKSSNEPFPTGVDYWVYHYVGWCIAAQVLMNGTVYHITLHPLGSSCPRNVLILSPLSIFPL